MCIRQAESRYCVLTSTSDGILYCQHCGQVDGSTITLEEYREKKEASDALIASRNGGTDSKKNGSVESSSKRHRRPRTVRRGRDRGRSAPHVY